MANEDDLEVDGIACYESTEDGDLIMYSDTTCGVELKIKIEHHELSRLLASVGSSMLKQESRR